MKNILSIVLILIFAFSVFAQSQPQPDVQSKTPQKVVIEKSNGDRLTGNFIGATQDFVTIELSGAKIRISLSDIDSITLNNTAHKILPTPVSETTAGTLNFKVGIVYLSGGAQPVARSPVALLDKSVSDILTDAGLKPERNLKLIETFAFASKYPDQYKTFSAAAVDAIKNHLVFETTTDFDGNGQFTDIKPGKYWLFCLTQTRKGFAIWDLPVTIQANNNSIILDQNNAATAF